MTTLRRRFSDLLPHSVGERVGRVARTLVASRPTLAVFVAIWAIGLVALGAVSGLAGRVDTARQAEVVVERLQRQVGDLAQVAVDPAIAAHGQGPTAAETGLQLQSGKQAIRTSLANLERFGRTPEEKRIAALTARYFPAIDHIAALVVAGSSLQAGVEFARIEKTTGPYGALLDELRQASATYSQNAGYSRLVGSIGTNFAILFMLLAFSFALYRAQRFAREKHQLLERSQSEALTDALTGLPNRRKLFADTEALLRSAPPEGLTLGMFDLDAFKEYNDTFGHPAGDALLARCGRKLAAAVEGRGTGYRMGGDEFCVIVPGAGNGADAVLADVEKALSERSRLFEIGCSRGSALITPGEMTIEQALQQADQRLYNDKRHSRKRLGGEGHDVLLRVQAEMSTSLSRHLTNVARLAQALARKLDLDDDQITLVRITAELHDVGKTAIPDALLEKRAPLDDEEREFLQRHTIIGERILAAAPALAEVAAFVRSTHERYDGAGYPDGLRGEEIPLVSRIVTVVDAFDAMTSRRPYRLAVNPERALAEIHHCSGSQFDPVVAAAFLEVMAARLDGVEDDERSDAGIAV